MRIGCMVGFPLIIVAFALLPARCNGSVTIQSSTTLSFEAMFGQPFDPQEHHRHLQKDVKDCKIVEKCEMCTFTDQKSIPACKETGRKNRMECDTRNGDDWTTETDFYSCKYTEADEQFAMIRFQMICVIVGLMALTSVKRQKRASASLFDQRKHAAEAARAKANTARRSEYVERGQDEEIEFTCINEETVPLVETSSNPLEIV